MAHIIPPFIGNIQMICQTAPGKGVNVDTPANAVPQYMDRQGVTHDPLSSALLPIQMARLATDAHTKLHS